jgi:hypothetical protein
VQQGADLQDLEEAADVRADERPVDPTVLEQHYRNLAAKRRALWLAPVGVVARYVQTQAAVELSATAVASAGKRANTVRAFVFLRTVDGARLPQPPAAMAVAVGPLPKSWFLKEAFAGGTEPLRIRQSAEWEHWDHQSAFTAGPLRGSVFLDDTRGQATEKHGDRIANGRDLYAIVDVVPPAEGALMLSLYLERYVRVKEAARSAESSLAERMHSHQGHAGSGLSKPQHLIPRP